MSPLKVFEYMSLGRAIVASDLPVLRECLQDGKSALLVDAGDVTAWCRAIDCMRDPAVRASLGSAARQQFEAKHTWHGRAHQVVANLPLSTTSSLAFGRSIRCLMGLI